LPNPLYLLRKISFWSESAWGNPLSVVDRIIGVIFVLDGCWARLSYHLWSMRHVSYGVLILTRKLRVMKIRMVIYEVVLFHVRKLRNPLLTRHRVNLIIIFLVVHLLISLVSKSSSTTSRD